MNAARHRVRAAAKDLAIRSGVLPYQPIRWNPEIWDRSFVGGATSAWADPDESARYGVLIGYLAMIGNAPALLDVGCGAGVLRSRLSRELFRSYLGIDPTEAAISQANALSDDVTEFQVADPMTRDLGLFDVVVCNEVLYFADDPFALADRMAAMLQPGGHLLTSIWRHPGDAVLWRHLDARLRLIDRVHIRNGANQLARRGWQVGWHQSD